MPEYCDAKKYVALERVECPPLTTPFNILVSTFPIYSDASKDVAPYRVKRPPSIMTFPVQCDAPMTIAP